MSIHNIDRDRAATVMRRLVGQIATPSYLLDEARELEDAGLMKFREWPSGHWSITDKGRNFLNAQ